MSSVLFTCDPNYIVGPGPGTPVIIGGILEVIVALAGIGTAVVLYPVVKRQNEAAALGFVGARVLEAAAIVAGVVSLLSAVTLRRAGAGAGALPTAQGLVASYNWSFLLGQSLMPVVNALLLGSLLYRSRLVPPVLLLVGLIGAPILLASDIAVLFGLWDRISAPSRIAAIPIALWEFSLGVYLVVKGFKPSPITAGMTASSARPAYEETAVQQSQDSGRARTRGPATVHEEHLGSPRSDAPVRRSDRGSFVAWTH